MDRFALIPQGNDALFCFVDHILPSAKEEMRDFERMERLAMDTPDV